MKTIAVVGMGYVGLPLALAFADIGLKVYGLDTDRTKIAALSRGESYINYLPAVEVRSGLEDGFEPLVMHGEAVTDCDAVIICVPTPLDHHGAPDVSAIEDVAISIGPFLRDGCLVVLESTSYPGTTRKVLAPILRELLQGNAKIHVAYSPERVDPGNEMRLRDIPKLVGGEDDAALDAAAKFYALVFNAVIPCASCEIAEAAKLVENAFRNVNIAFVNELKTLFDRMNLDVWAVLDAAETKPYGFMRFNPGAGLGGHCIPIDPFYLAWACKGCGVTARMIELAGRINNAMPEYVVQKAVEALNTAGKAVNGASLLLLGVAYKPGVDDLRESPSMAIWKRLAAMGARIHFYDPEIKTVCGETPDPWVCESVKVNCGLEFDAALVLAVTEIPNGLLDRASIVIDTRNLVSNAVRA
jgi:UDP-N-acetyl-D-glucosamine dehydrogenase